MKDHFITLIGYHAWANQKLLEHVESLSDDVFNQEVQSVFPSIRHTFAHMIMADRVWLELLKGEPEEEVRNQALNWNEEALKMSLEEMKEAFAGLADQFKQCLQRHPDIHQPTKFTLPHGGNLTMSAAEMATYIANHGTYHRGNITAMLRQMGHASVQTDYVVYLYEIQQ